MERTDPETPQTPGRLWCPGCKRWLLVVDPLVRASTSPQAWEVHLDGSLDMGQPGDAFLDYEHLECGAWVRLVANATYSEELGQYTDGANAFVEVNLKGKYVVPELDESTREALGESLLGKLAGADALFTSSVEDDPEHWGPTYDALLEAYKEARSVLAERTGRSPGAGPRRPLGAAAELYAQELRQAAGPNATFQEAIDALPDHNQAMIDCIQEASPDLSGAVDELMELEDDQWTPLINHVFDLAKSDYEGGDAR